LVRASGFTQVKLGPIETGDYDNDDFGGRQSVLTANDQGMVSSQMRKKNLLMFSG